jgi:hypothetical protein
LLKEVFKHIDRLAYTYHERLPAPCKLLTQFMETLFNKRPVGRIEVRRMNK